MTLRAKFFSFYLMEIRMEKFNLLKFYKPTLFWEPMVSKGTHSFDKNLTSTETPRDLASTKFYVKFGSKKDRSKLLCAKSFLFIFFLLQG